MCVLCSLSVASAGLRIEEEDIKTLMQPPRTIKLMRLQYYAVICKKLNILVFKLCLKECTFFNSKFKTKKIH